MDVTPYEKLLQSVGQAMSPDSAGDGSMAPKITPLPEDAAALGITPGVASVDQPSFKDTVMKVLHDTNDKINTSDQNVRDLAMGKTNDLGSVVTSVEEANLALNFTMAMRSKMIEAYQEVTRMQI